jgi:hypothetical protein
MGAVLVFEPEPRYGRPSGIGVILR